MRLTSHINSKDFLGLRLPRLEKFTCYLVVKTSHCNFCAHCSCTLIFGNLNFPCANRKGVERVHLSTGNRYTVVTQSWGHFSLLGWNRPICFDIRAARLLMAVCTGYCGCNRTGNGLCLQYCFIMTKLMTFCERKIVAIKRN